MRIGVISDTHIPSRSRELPGFVASAFAGVELILHAGDINELSVLSTLNSIAPTRAVAGNTDSRETAEALGYELLLSLGRFRVGLTHGHLGRGKTTPDRAYNTFKDRADVIIFGHSHQPFEKIQGSVLLLNPGSPTNKRRQPKYSVAILSLTKRAHSEILYFE